MKLEQEESSFRDRDGFVFYQNNEVFRTVEKNYLPAWEALVQNGLLEDLQTAGKLIRFKEFSREEGRLILSVEKIPFISYPAEWTYIQLKKAALLTLDIQLTALQQGFSLKDASAYNVQFSGNAPVFIDLLSFEKYTEGRPWTAYGQFCRHFLAPLLMLYHRLPAVQSLFTTHIDGIPLQLCARTLPWTSRFSLLSASHIHLHARLEKKHAADVANPAIRKQLPKNSLLAMLQHMRDSIAGMKRKPSRTNWTNYYGEFSYSDAAFVQKKDFTRKVLEMVKPDRCVDLGCNTGEFSLLASQYCKSVIACDFDEEVVSALNRKKNPEILGLVIDLSNPTPSYGWHNRERKSFITRAAGSELVLALALIHHLCISNNVPLTKVAELFAELGHNLVIEFVPKDDPQAKKLLVSRRDVFDDYTEEAFRKTFGKYFSLISEQKVEGSGRIMFHMRRTVV